MWSWYQTITAWWLCRTSQNTRGLQEPCTPQNPPYRSAGVLPPIKPQNTSVALYFELSGSDLLFCVSCWRLLMEELVTFMERVPKAHTATCWKNKDIQRYCHRVNMALIWYWDERPDVCLFVCLASGCSRLLWKTLWTCAAGGDVTACRRWILLSVKSSWWDIHRKWWDVLSVDLLVFDTFRHFHPYELSGLSVSQELFGAVQVSPLSSGYSLGSSNWIIQSHYEKVSYVSGSSLLTTHPQVSMSRRRWCCQTEVFICSAVHLKMFWECSVCCVSLAHGPELTEEQWCSHPDGPDPDPHR